ncbi:DNA methylase N-4/N-6 domain protein [Burkholderia pseudomallei]|nr:DNA methylase N-4/N-6 domain protein [Burkholderia pseudomallei]
MPAKPRAKRFQFDTDDAVDKRHFVFRYPAKFHAPVARQLISQFSNEGDTILDPFCGSGTLLLEAIKMGRDCIGVDIDPVAAFVSTAKCAKWNVRELRDAVDRLSSRLAEVSRDDATYERFAHEDIASEEAATVIARENLWVPEIPRIGHWFRQYVIVDMARILHVIESEIVKAKLRPFFYLCFASAIRASSNADPVPVSGLEVTSHMKRKDAEGRVVNPFANFTRAVRKGLAAMESSAEFERLGTCSVLQGDATELSKFVSARSSVCITSPPYHGAVDYYRRHTLEMYWLGMVSTQADRLALLPRYIGKSTVARRHHFLAEPMAVPALAKWENRMRKISADRADAFKHYVVSMGKTFDQLAHLLPAGGKAILVVGKSTWNGFELPTTSLFADLCQEKFDFCEQYWYPLKNRYMSYSRHNGADIDKEYVAVFRRRP